MATFPDRPKRLFATRSWRAWRALLSAHRCPAIAPLPSMRLSAWQLTARFAMGCIAIGWLAAGTVTTFAQGGTEPGDVTWAIADESTSTDILPASFSRTDDDDSLSETPASGETAHREQPIRAQANHWESAAASTTADPLAAPSMAPGVRPHRTAAPATLALAPSRLPLPNDSRSSLAAADATRKSTSRFGNTSVLTALALVLGGTAAALWFGKRVGPLRRGRLPAEVFEHLGKAPLNPKLDAYLLRVGSKLVLVGVQAGEARTLTEITDPAEVQRMVAACATATAASSTVVGSIADTVSVNPMSQSMASAANAARDDAEAELDRSLNGKGRSSFAASLRRSLSRLETQNA